jgi:hypothetical protein
MRTATESRKANNIRTVHKEEVGNQSNARPVYYKYRQLIREDYTLLRLLREPQSRK